MKTYIIKMVGDIEKPMKAPDVVFEDTFTIDKDMSLQEVINYKERLHPTLKAISIEEIKPKLPKTWKEFCKLNTAMESWWISGDSTINKVTKIQHLVGRNPLDKNLLPSKEIAEAFIALMQLVQLRDCYRGNWTPNWENKVYKYIICYVKDTISVDAVQHTSYSLSFQSAEIRDEFLENFKDLIEVAKPLL